MAPTSAALHPPQTVIQQEIARVYSHRTASLHVPSTFASRIFCPVGRGPQMTRCFSRMPVDLTSTSQMGSITLQTLALPHQMHCSSPIEMCGTICQNGVLAITCKLSNFKKKFSLTSFQVHRTPRSCSICVMRQPVMLSSGSLGFSSGDFESSRSQWSMT